MDRDEESVRLLEAAYDQAWKAGDMAALLACLHQDAVVVDPRGRTSAGHKEIEQTLGDLLRGAARDSSHTTRIDAIDFVHPDVAVVDGHARVESPTGAMEHRFTDIAVREGDAWRIVHVRAYGLSGP